MRTRDIKRINGGVIHFVYLYKKPTHKILDIIYFSSTIEDCNLVYNAIISYLNSNKEESKLTGVSIKTMVIPSTKSKMTSLSIYYRNFMRYMFIKTFNLHKPTEVPIFTTENHKYNKLLNTVLINILNNSKFQVQTILKFYMKQVKKK